MRRKWTADEEATLIRMVQEKHTSREVARALDRPVGSIWQKMERMRRQGRIGFFANQRGLRDIDRRRVHHLVRKILKRALVDGYTFKRLGKQSGVSWGTIRGWEFSSPKIENLEAVANALGFHLMLVDAEGREAA